MIDRAIAWCIDNRLLVVVAAAAMLGWGVFELARMPVDVFPELTAPTVTVLVDAHEMAPQEVERLVVFPLEAAMGGLPGVRRTRSISEVGGAVLWIEFDWGVEIHRARQDVSERMQFVREKLPEGLPSPVMAPVNSLMGEVMFVGLTPNEDAVSQMDLRTVADRLIKPRILAVPGVSQVFCYGGDVRQFQVILDPLRMISHGLSATAVAEALGATNENTSAGFYIEGGREYVIRGLGRVFTPDDVSKTVIEVRQGRPITVGDLGEVRIGSATKRGSGSFNGMPAVIIGIQKQPESNTLALTRRLDEAFGEIESGLPAGMEIHTDVFRQADFIEVAIENVGKAIRDGAILVVAIILVFMMSLRASAISVLAIPLSLAAAILTLKATGATVNTMTLGGIAIAVGSLVDDAIISVENTVRRLRLRRTQPPEQRQPALTVVREAVSEIRNSIVFATFIIMLVFLPLFFLDGVEGRLLRPLGEAYIISLFASLVVALTVTPALCVWLLPRSRAVRSAGEPLVTRAVKRAYARLLDASLRHWRVVAVATVLPLALAALFLIHAGRDFLPDFNEGSLTISTVTLPGTSLAESDRLGRMAEEVLLDHPEVVAVARRTGRDDLDEHGLAPHSSEIDVGLALGGRGKADFIAALRESLVMVPGLTAVIGQPISHRIDHMLSGTRSSIAVKIHGDDLHTLRRLSAEAAALMRDVPGVVDLVVEQQWDIPVVTVRYDRQAMALHGLTVREVSHAIETAFGGRVVAQVQEGSMSYDLVLRYSPEVLDSFDSLRRAMVSTPSGAAIPLHTLADVRKDSGPSSIGRENARRRIVVSCNVAGRDLGSVVDEIRARIGTSLELPPGYRVEYGGQFQSAKTASRTLSFLALAVVAGIFLLLFVAFGSWRDAVLVMLNLPLALVGGVVGVHLAGGVLTVASTIAFISLLGIATRNGIMLVTHIRHLSTREGVPDATSAVRQGALERVVPILMTATATGLGLLPLALAAGEPGSEIQAPMAIVLICGLGSSTLLNMIVVPALYLRFGAFGQRPTT